jgi:hypothetical protein
MRMKRFSITGLAAAALAMAGCSHGAAGSSTDAQQGSTMSQQGPQATAPVAPQATAPLAPQPGGAGPDASAPQAAADDQASDEVRDHHRHHHHGGVSMFIAMSIDTLGVAPEKQAQLQQIQRQLHQQMAGSREAERNLLSALADGIRRGSVDGRSLAAAQDKIDTTEHAASMDALNQLHAALSAAERAALAEKVQAHWEVWRKVNADEDYGSREKGTHLARLTERLKLTPEQVDRISSALKSGAPPKADSAAVEGHVHGFAGAFAADDFDARSLRQPDASHGQLGRPGTARMVRFYEIVTPLLTPDQRTTLADHLRDRANDSHAISSN